jgi:esterase/lipase
MFENLPLSMSEQTPDYPITDSRLPFAEYITLSQNIIKQRRKDLQPPANAKKILDANSPCEFIPDSQSGQRFKYGVLLIHGLLDCPFSVKDLGRYLQSQGILCRSILLPGHGTRPEDLLSVTYQEWIQAVQYGIDSLRHEVDHLYLAGYSTGAALSVHQALKGTPLSGIILLAPAIRIKVPMNLIVGWRYLKKWLHINHNQWIDKIPEIDYTKYLSIPFNAVNQVGLLTDEVKNIRKNHQLTCPIFMALTQEDETISSQIAMKFFADYHDPKSKLLLYAATPQTYQDPRIIVRSTNYPDLNIKHFSHVSLPYAPDNSHYGQHGDYQYAARIDNKNCIYGAYSRVESNVIKQFYQRGLLKYRYQQLTYNPDFAEMAEEILKFIVS